MTSTTGGAAVAGVSVLPLAFERPHAAKNAAAATSNSAKTTSLMFVRENIVLTMFLRPTDSEFRSKQEP